MKILITGASGTGTTTFGKYIATQHKWNFIDVDDYFWLPSKPPYENKRDTKERLNLILNKIDKYKSNVVSGSVMNWGKELEDSFDLIIFLYVETSIRVSRLKEREIIKLGYINPEFIKWASEYDNDPKCSRSYTKHKEWLSHRKCKIIKIEDNLTTEKRYQILLNELKNLND